MFKNKQSHMSQHALSELLKQFSSTKVALFLCFETFSLFHFKAGSFDKSKTPTAGETPRGQPLTDSARKAAEELEAGPNLFLDQSSVLPDSNINVNSTLVTIPEVSFGPPTGLGDESVNRSFVPTTSVESEIKKTGSGKEESGNIDCQYVHNMEQLLCLVSLV